MSIYGYNLYLFETLSFFRQSLCSARFCFIIIVIISRLWCMWRRHNSILSPRSPCWGDSDSWGVTFLPLALAAAFPFSATLFNEVPSHSSPLLSYVDSYSKTMVYSLSTGGCLFGFLATCLEEEALFGGMIPASTHLLVTK